MSLLKGSNSIEALPSEEKDKVYYLIDMALAYKKTKKAFAL
ncbi:hypothetical protein WG904_16415 [Pedobacter sp. Du54]